MKSGTRLRKAIAEAKAKIKAGKVQDAIVCSTLSTEEEKDTHTVIINPNFIKALRDKGKEGKLPENMVVINMDEVSDVYAVSAIIYSLGLPE